jgi:hypothetical protein
MSKTLRDELQTTGASGKEARELATLAGQFASLKDRRALLPDPTPNKSSWFRLAPVLTTAFVFLFIGMAVVTTAQASIPGNVLYPVKQLSENTAAAIVPSYHATLMMRRADEVKQLVAKHASSKQVLATLADYSTQASAYKTKDYAAYTYCKNSLEQAAANANAAEKPQIASTIASISDLN